MESKLRHSHQRLEQKLVNAFQQKMHYYLMITDIYLFIPLSHSILSYTSLSVIDLKQVQTKPYLGKEKKSK